MLQADARPGGVAVGKLTATIQEPWHLYSPTTPPGGPIITSMGVADNPAIAKVEVLRPQPVRKLDPNFGIDTETYDKQAVFYLRLTLAPGAAESPVEVTANVRYQACTDTQCLPPVRKSAAATLQVKASASELKWEMPAGYAVVPESKVPESKGKPAATPAAGKASPPSAPAKPQGAGELIQFAIVAFGLGLASIFTPCVFPMIPFTVTYFLNQKSGGRADSIIQAAVFSGGIVLLFTSLGLLATAIMGPFGVVQLGANLWVNLFIFAVFTAFSFSLLGAFEITLPSGLLTKMNSMSERGGYLGSLLMGLTFSLTSFACVGPFVGSLLAASVQGDKLQPTIGMLGFSSGLASPFFLLALFPSTMSRMPRSGGWLPRVKTVFGFILLAISLKYLSNIDQVLQWGFLTRERFLAAWVVLFALPGLYLFGFIRMEGIKPDQQLGVSRALIAALFLIFAISLLPGMFGGKLGELDAYVPLAQEGSYSNSATGERLTWMKDQYPEALAKAKQENKLLFVNFTGHTCTNCKWMKSNMFPKPEVMAELKKFVLVELYNDGADATAEKIQDLQQSKFNTIAVPFYALMDGDEKVIATFPRLTRDAKEFVSFLQTGQGEKAPSL
ncbi:MAG: thioredoxin family protein [Acidobacteria bacterium]|nr:thioredoxin family protein [Acidobacteriota bacterium]